MPRVAPRPEDIAEIYVDESSQTQNRYLVLGGLIIEHLARPRLEAAIQSLRLPELPRDEMKWAKVSRTKLQAYIRVVEGFWGHADIRGAHFHSAVIDTHRVDHGVFNLGSPDIGFNKEVYQLVTKFARVYRPHLFHVYLDRRNTNQSPDDLRLILNRGRAKNGDLRDWPYRRCHFKDSADCLPLQLVDIFIGAIAYHLNGHINQAGASPAKTALAKRVFQLAGIGNCTVNTAIAAKFTIWHRQLRPTPRTTSRSPRS
jgi:uncharacterized protein DUF3800